MNFNCNCNIHNLIDFEQDMSCFWDFKSLLYYYWVESLNLLIINKLWGSEPANHNIILIRFPACII